MNDHNFACAVFRSFQFHYVDVSGLAEYRVQNATDELIVVWSESTEASGLPFGRIFRMSLLEAQDAPLSAEGREFESRRECHFLE